jgi:AraC-like DNA-binding protein
MAELTEKRLLDTGLISLRDISCHADCGYRSPVECADGTAIVLPYRGLFIRHLGQDEAVGEPNQALFFNRHQEFRISYPLDGGDDCLSLALDDGIIRELVPHARLAPGPDTIFLDQRVRIGPAAQALAARLRHGLSSGNIDILQAETLALALVQQIGQGGRTPAQRISVGKRKLVDRAKLILTSDPGRRWTLAQIGREAGCSPVYLTQLFQLIEGMPLYRYQLQLRLAKALDDVADHDNLTMLALDLGFSSHSHFSSAFQSAFGCTPSAFRETVRSTPRLFR